MDRAAVARRRRVSGHGRLNHDILCFGNADRAGLGVDRAAFFCGVVCYADALVEPDHDGAGAIHRAAVARLGFVSGYLERTG